MRRGGMPTPTGRKITGGGGIEGSIWLSEGWMCIARASAGPLPLHRDFGTAYAWKSFSQKCHSTNGLRLAIPSHPSSTSPCPRSRRTNGGRDMQKLSYTVPPHSYVQCSQTVSQTAISSVYWACLALIPLYSVWDLKSTPKSRKRGERDSSRSFNGSCVHRDS